MGDLSRKLEMKKPDLKYPNWRRNVLIYWHGIRVGQNGW